MIKTISLTISQVLSVLLNFSVQLILAHFYGKHETGSYLSIISLMNILSVLGLFGINKYYIFLKSKNGNIDKLVASNIIKIYFLMNVISIIIISIIGLINFRNYIFLILSSVVMMVLTNCIAIITSYIQVREKIIKVSFIQLIVPFLKVIGLIGGFFILNFMFKGYSLIVLTISAIVFSFIFFTYLKIVLSYDLLKLDGFYLTFKSLMPYAILSLTFLLYTQGNTFYIGVWLDSKSAAYFGLAYLFLNTIFVFPTAIYQRLLAHKLLYLLYNSFDEFKKLLSNLQDILIILSSIVILLLYISAKFFIVIFFGESYLKSVEILQTLAFIIPFRLLSISIGTVLSNDDYIKERIKVEIFVTFLNFLTNLIFIKILGIYGAIISAILTEFLLSLSFAKVIKDEFKIKVKFSLYLPLLVALLIHFIDLPQILEYIIVSITIIILIKPIVQRVKLIKKYI